MDEQISQDVQRERCFNAILHACLNKDWEALHHCKRALVNITDHAGRNVLLHILASGERERALEMISKGIALHAADEDGNTPAHYAARLGDLEMLQELHEHTSPLFEQNMRGETPMHAAIGAGQVDVVKALLRKGRDFTALFAYENILRLTPVAYAAVRGEVECMNELLKAGADLELPDNPIGNVLHLIVYFHQNEVLIDLLKHHLNKCKHLFEKKDAKNGRTPLLLACRVNNQQAVIILSSFGAVLEARDLKMRTPMHYAGMQRNPDLLEVLFYLGCDPSAQDVNRNFPIDFVTDEDELGREVRGIFQLIMTFQKKPGIKIPQLRLEPVTNLIFRCDSFPCLSSLAALKVLHKNDALEHLVRIGGSSWGAIVGTLTAFGYTWEEMVPLFAKIERELFLDPVKKNEEFLQKALIDLEGKFETKNEKEWAWLIKMGINPGLRSGESWQLLKVAHLFKESQGLCIGENFRMWIESLIHDVIKKQTGLDIPHCTFGELRDLRKKFPIFKHLHLFTGKGRNSRESVHISSEDPDSDSLIISDVVRACLIRGLYIPHVLHEKVQGERRARPDLGEFADRVMIYVSTVEAFDKKKYLIDDVLLSESDYPAYNPQTLLVDVRHGTDKVKDAKPPSRPKTPSDLLIGIGRIYQLMGTLSRQAPPFNRHRVIEVNVDPQEDQNELFMLGERVAQEFCDRHGEKAIASYFLYNMPRLFMQLKGTISLPEAHPHFFGRAEELSELQRELLGKKRECIERSVVHILYGPEGRGKTELAVAFANKHLQEFSLIGMISCATHQEKISDYLHLARALKLDVRGDYDELLVQKVHKALEENMEKPWLLIFKGYSSNTFPFPKRGGLVLVAAKHKPHGSHLSSTEVLPLSKKDTISLFLTGARQSLMDLETLIRWSDGNPLIVDLMSRTMRIHKLSHNQYASLLQTKISFLAVENSFPSILQFVLEYAMKDLSPPALEWLYICAFLNAGRIPLDYFSNWFASLPSLERNRIKQSLEDRALLRFDSARNCFSIHPSIQEILARSSPQSTAGKALGLLIRMEHMWDFDEETSAEMEQRASVWMEHAYKACVYVFSSQREKGLFLKKMSSWEEEYGNFPQALRMYKQALPLLEAEKKQNDVELEECWEKMGFCYLMIENYKEAMIYLMKSLNVRNPLEERDENRFSTLHNLGICHLKQGKPQVALSYLTRALKVIQEELEGDYLESAKCLDNMGACYYEMENFEEAKNKKEEALSLYKKGLGDNHLQVAKTLEELAHCYIMLNEEGKTIKCLQEALDIVVIRFGSDHPSAVSLRKALGLLQREGKRDKCVIQ